MATLQALADARRATPGRCCVQGCAQHAYIWHRSGRRATDADGLALAIRACSEHETTADEALSQLTLADVVNLIPRSRRKNRARTARAQADKLLGRAQKCERTGADLRGASSTSHTYALVGGYRRLEAEALDALADALNASA